jgi:hypothetical protein
MRRRGVAIGEEFRGKGINVHLGPSVGVSLTLSFNHLQQLFLVDVN